MATALIAFFRATIDVSLDFTFMLESQNTSGDSGLELEIFPKWKKMRLKRIYIDVTRVKSNVGLIDNVILVRRGASEVQ